MYKRFVNPKAKNNNEIVILLSKDFRGAFVKVVSTGKKFYCNINNLKQLTNSELLNIPKYHRG